MQNSLVQVHLLLLIVCSVAESPGPAFSAKLTQTRSVPKTGLRRYRVCSTRCGGEGACEKEVSDSSVHFDDAVRK